MKKRILALLLAVLILGSVLTPAAFADDGHVITFDPRATEGGSLNGTTNWRRIEEGKPIGEMPIPTNSNPNMTFEGWFDEDNKQYTADTILTADVVVHAYWMEKQLTMPFTDITGHWAYEGIKYCFENGLMNGMTPTTFGPELTTTRAMVVTVLYRMEKEPPVGGLTNPFTDVKFEDWYGSAIVWAAHCGVVNGITSDTFDPNGNITREQLAAILYRYANYSKYTTDIHYVLNDFADKDSVSAYAVEAMQWAYAMDLITGMEEGGKYYLKPGANATRAQIATILTRFTQKVIPHETELNDGFLVMTLPKTWFNENTWVSTANEDGSYSLNFYCRKEQEAGAGGFLFTIDLVEGSVPSYPSAYEVVGTLTKGEKTFNVVIVYPGGVECDKYQDLYNTMRNEKDAIVASFQGVNGWTYTQTGAPVNAEVILDGLGMTLPLSWNDEYDKFFGKYEDGTSYVSFYCRKEKEDGAGGYLFSVALVEGPIPAFPMKYEVPGAISKDGKTVNVVILFSSDVQFSKYQEQYMAMLAGKDEIVSSFHGVDGWSYGVG